MVSLYFAADNYSCDTYGASAYSECPQTGTQPQTPGGGLSNTGYEIIIPLALAGALIIASIILFAKKIVRRKR